MMGNAVTRRRRRRRIPRPVEDGPETLCDGIDHGSSSELSSTEEYKFTEEEHIYEPDFDNISSRIKRHERSLLAGAKDPPMHVQELRYNLVENREDPNEVETGGYGYGAIHYLVECNHGNKKDLLTCLAIEGQADLDLTTTQLREVTALHLACKMGDHRSVQILISLGADVNKRDEFGSTPLDYAQQAIETPAAQKDVPLKDLKRGDTVILPGEQARDKGFDETVEITKSHADTIGVPDKSMDSKIIEMLKEVGAVSGQDVKSSIQCTRPEKLKVDCRMFKQKEDEVHMILKKETPTEDEALKVVQLLKDHQEYRRIYGSRILCLDGGGIRGLVQICILQEIEWRTGKPVTELFDWIVGTSTGGVIALALIYGQKNNPLLGVRSEYWQKKDKIFGKGTPGIAKGNTKELETALMSWVGEKRLGEKKKPCVLVPAVEKSDTDLKLHFFNNCFDNEYSNELVWKVARYTSAAPFYFTEFENYIDGGLLANNPSVDALTEIQHHFHEKGQKLPISLVVSIGAGVNPPEKLGKINVHQNVLDLRAWSNFVGVLSSAIHNESADKNCRSRCEEQHISYFRFDPQLNEKVDSDEKNEEKLMKMLYRTRVYLAKKEPKEKLDQLIQLLQQSSLSSPAEMIT